MVFSSKPLQSQVAQSASPTSNLAVAILGALGRELIPILSQIRADRACHTITTDRYRRHGARFWRLMHGTQPVVLVQMGAGKAHARRAVEALLSEGLVGKILCVGYAGALAQDIPIGALILAEHVLSIEGEDRQRYEADPEMLEQAHGVCQSQQGDITIFKGELLSVSGVIDTMTEKRSLAAKSGAIALDMESAAVAALSQEAQIPCLAVRVVSDRLDEDLRGVSQFLAQDGSFRPVRGLLYALTHPWVFSNLNRARAHTTLASANLGRFVHDFLHRLS